MSFAGYTTVDVETNRTLSISTGSNSTSPSEGRGNLDTTPRWDLVKTGSGTWIMSNTDLALPTNGGPLNGAGFIRVDQGVFDITGDYGRGSLSVNGGTLLSGTFSPFTYSTAAGAFALGVPQTSLLEVTTAGGKIGISAAASSAVTRSVSFNWDQSGTSKLTLASRDALDLVFATAFFPNVLAGNTLAIDRDGSGIGKVQINDTAVDVAGKLAGSGLLQMGSAGLGTLTVSGTIAPGSTLGTLAVTANLALSGSLAIDVSGALADRLNVTSADLNLTGAALAFTSLTVPTAPSYILLSYSGTLTGNTNSSTGNTFASLSGLPSGYVLVHDTVLKQIRLESTGSTPYQTWANGFLPGFTNTGATVDFENDGISNLLEFVLGGNPTINDNPSIRPTVSASGSNLVIAFKRSDVSELQPVAVKVQISSNLSTWNPADDILIGPATNPGPVGSSGASYTVDETGALDSIVVTIPKGAATKKFVRVVATE
ncbi:MAG: hypothetical protein ABI600_21390 [Luteolibacter sp.]